MNLEELLNWIPIFVILGIILTGIILWRRASMNYRIEELKQQKAQIKKQETFEGSITDLIDTAPEKIKQVESEIMTIKREAAKKGLTSEQTKAVVSRLESELDGLQYLVKYGKYAKPIIKPLGGLLEKFIGRIG